MLLGLFGSCLAHACPMCSDIVGRGKDALAAMRFGDGIAWSILLMLAMPFLMVGSLVWVILRAQKRKQQVHRLPPSRE